MKYAWYATLLLAWTATGCLSNRAEHGMNPLWKNPPAEPAKPAPLVTPGQVKPDNAHAVSQALWDEMDRQAQNEVLAEAAQTSSLKK